MKLLQVLTAMREQKLSESKKKSIVEFGVGFEYAGAVYKNIGTAIELVGKALQTKETADEIFNCMTDVKNRIVDTGIMIVTKNAVAFEQVEESINTLNQKQEDFVNKQTAAFAQECRDQENQETEDEDYTEMDNEEHDSATA